MPESEVKVAFSAGAPHVSRAHSAVTSASVSSARRRHLERMSPTAGPPSTLTISAVLPPSSDTGRMCVTLVVSCRRCPESHRGPFQVCYTLEGTVRTVHCSHCKANMP